MTLDDLQTLREGSDFEAKLAAGRDGRGAVPASLWESSAAMANTFGASNLLGARELPDGVLPKPMGKGSGRSYRQSDLDHSARVASPTSTSPTSTSSTSTAAIPGSFSSASTAEAPVIARVADAARASTEDLRAAILAVCKDEFRTLSAITDALHRTPNAVRPQLRALLAEGALEPRFPDSPSHPRQAYRTRRDR